MVSQNQLISGEESQNQNIVITSKINHNDELLNEQVQDGEIMETVPGITDSSQIKRQEKPSMPANNDMLDSRSMDNTREFMIYKDMNQRYRPKEDRMKIVDGPVLGRTTLTQYANNNNDISNYSEKKSPTSGSKQVFGGTHQIERVESELRHHKDVDESLEEDSNEQMNKMTN